MMSRSTGNPGHNLAPNSGLARPSNAAPIDFNALYEETCRVEDLLTVHPTPSNIANIRRVIAHHNRVIKAFTERQAVLDRASSHPTAPSPPSSTSMSDNAGASAAIPSSGRTGRVAQRAREDFRRTSNAAIVMLTERVEALEEALQLRNRPNLFRETMRRIQGEGSG